ncbi:glycosyltransferase family 2 protein [Candidatus Microgenomates bacterium]|nr:glycosyltransferase family 2 protein [Candidatus Microgenomates bacterium]
MDVSVVVVSYNAASYLKECVEAIFNKTKGPSFEVIVVDNASTDDSVAVAKSFGKRIILLKGMENRGYAAGANAGIKKATGKFVLILNPDILFLEDAISKMLAYMNGHPEVGLAGCTFLDGVQKMLPNGGYFPTLIRLSLWTFFVRIGNDYHPSANRYKADFYPDWVTGGFMFVRREVVDKVGLLDENIFLYGEEVEWQYRIKSAGWRIGYTTTTKVNHFERKSSGGMPRNAILGEFKGLRYIYGKYFPGWKQVLVGTLLDVAAFLRILMWLLRFKPQMAKIYLEALLL